LADGGVAAAPALAPLSDADLRRHIEAFKLQAKGGKMNLNRLERSL
jgi:hypothetical protein